MTSDMKSHILAVLNVRNTSQSGGYVSRKQLHTDLIASYAPEGTITGIATGSITTITDTAHGLVSGERVILYDVAGMTEINQLTATVTVINANSFSVPIDSSAFTAYSSAGNWRKMNNLMTVTAISKAVPTATVLTIADHGFWTGDTAKFSDVVSGMTELNGAWVTITRTDKDNIRINVNTTAYTTFTTSTVTTMSLYGRNREDDIFRKKFKVAMKALKAAGSAKGGFDFNGVPTGYKPL